MGKAWAGSLEHGFVPTGPLEPWTNGLHLQNYAPALPGSGQVTSGRTLESRHSDLHGVFLQNEMWTPRGGSRSYAMLFFFSQTTASNPYKATATLVDGLKI